ncbi:MAG: ComF family protein [Gemmatimonadota bacterium]|nr:MAG: ComF family protein [Gemmatimonadota bacterium]
MANRWIRSWLDRLLPAVCLVCGDPLGSAEGRVCGLCWARARRPRHPLCPRCGIALQDTGTAGSSLTCGECREWLPYLRRARASFIMSGTAAAMVHALKYGGWKELAREMGAEMAAQSLGKGLEGEIAAVLPVPLSRTRLRERGFNQAELLAAVVAERWNRPLLRDVLVRHLHTRRQARLAPRERLANVSGAFAVRRSTDLLADAHVLLVDDVLTTAATVQECVRALCGAGARAVSVVTFARARPELPRADR